MIIRLAFFLLVLISCTYNEIEPICNPDPIFYNDIIKPILDVHCSDCHSDGSGRALLSNYNQVISAQNEHDLLDRVINFEMPPYGAQPSLNQSDILIIRNWIDCE
tara:strand:- start:7261 stop:7575 length:315 start_codon:yes stop_codon:yes gene_type:complete